MAFFLGGIVLPSTSSSGLIMITVTAAIRVLTKMFEYPVLYVIVFGTNMVLICPVFNQ